MGSNNCSLAVGVIDASAYCHCTYSFYWSKRCKNKNVKKILQTKFILYTNIICCKKYSLCTRHDKSNFQPLLVYDMHNTVYKMHNSPTKIKCLLSQLLRSQVILLRLYSKRVQNLMYSSFFFLHIFVVLNDSQIFMKIL